MKIAWLKLLVVLIVLSYLIVLLVKNWTIHNEAVLSLDELEKSVKTSGRQRVELQKKIDHAQTDEFVEEQARDTLNMVKEGETVLVMPKDLPQVVEDQE